mgnify:FL=1
MTPVTRLTVDATLDEFSAGDYRDMVQELRQTYSLRQLDELVGNICSPALWAKVEHGEAVANRAQRNALRKLFNKPPLPPTVAECTAQASPDAAVWTVGEGVPDTVVMVAGTEPVTLRVNGTVQVVTPVTVRRERQPVEVFRPMLDVADREAMKSLGHKYSAREIWQMGIKAARALE